jgi:glycosyltransferase involved in cell wall biosynthesis
MPETGIRIAMIEPSGRGGLCHHSYNLCRALADHGCDVHLVTADPYELENLPHNFKVSKFRMRTASGLLNSIRKVAALKPNIVHYQATNLHPFFEWAYMWACKLLTGAPFVVVAHEVIPHVRTGWQLPFIGRKLRKSNAVVVHSENTRTEAMNECDVPPERVHVIPVGDYRFLRDLAPFGKPAPWAKVEGVKDILFFGGIMKYKGLMHLINAVAQLKSAGHKVRLAVVGRPVDPWEEYEAAIGEAGLQDDVLTWLGYIDTADIPGVFAFADVVAVPYLFCSESAVLLAADALDRPVVATSVGGNVAAYEQGLAQELVPPGDEEVLAAALERTLFHLDHEDYLLNKAQRDDSARSWSNIAARTIDLYNSLLSGARKAAMKTDVVSTEP